ncbi:MAG: FAD-dependent oxidoreductase, partial [Clostridia bacterium]|nr:FAD-dependent oxidoreductase [Clostridia bacterium]
MSKHDLSRRDFLKGAAASAVGIAAMGLVSGCGSTSAEATAAPVTDAPSLFTPGTYTATAQGMGEVTVTMTFDASSITDVQLNLAGETEDIGQAAGDTLIEQILGAQDSEIDGVSGASVTSNAVKEAAASCVQQAMGIVAEPTPATETDVAAEGGDWLGEEPEVDSVSETLDFDVVVIGAGLSGICAARAAAEEGASVAIVEKSASFNCRSGEYAVLNGTLNKRWGRDGIVDTD